MFGQDLAEDLRAGGMTMPARILSVSVRVRSFMIDGAGCVVILYRQHAAAPEPLDSPPALDAA